MRIFLIFCWILSFNEILCDNKCLFEPLYGPSEGSAREIVIDSNGTFYINSLNGIFKSSDNGSTWINVFNEGLAYSLTLDNDNTLLMMKKNFEDLYSNSYPEKIGLYKTNNSGLSWDFIKDDSVGKIVFDKENNQLLKIVMVNPDAYIYNLYKSDDKGMNWEIVYSGLKGDNASLYFYSFKQSNKYLILNCDESPFITGGEKMFLMISSDQGKSWKKTTPFKERIQSYIFLDSSRILAACANGLKYSIDKGQTWKSANIDEDSYLTKQIPNGNLYASTFHGLYVSKDTNFNWIKITDKFIINFEILPNGRFVGYDFHYIYVSDDSGKTWTNSTKGFTATSVYDYAFDNDTNIYCFSSEDQGLKKYTKKTDSWEKIVDSYVRAVGNDRYGNIYMAVETDHTDIYRSIDNGITWELLNKDKKLPIRVVYFLFTKEDYIYCVSTSHYLIRSFDLGKTWDYLNVDSDLRNTVVNSEGHLLAGGSWGEITRSTDRGGTWHQLIKPDNGVTIYSMGPILINPYNGFGYAFNSDIIYTTTDNGRTWVLSDDKKMLYYNIYNGVVDINGNIILLSMKNIFVHLNNEDTLRKYENNCIRYFSGIMRIAPDGSIYLSTLYGGLYRLRLDLIDGLSVEEVRPSPLFAFPNPAQEKVTIMYEASALPSTLLVTDILGNRVTERSLPDAGTGAGSYTLDIDGYSPGVYLYTVSSGSSVGRGKFVVK